MATGNFINHENGIFAVLEPSIEDYMDEFIECNYDNYRDSYIEDDEDDEDYMAYYDQFVTDVQGGQYNDIMWDSLSILYEEELESTWEALIEAIQAYGYSVWERNGSIIVTNAQYTYDRYVATISREPGYYSGMQFIVDTDYMNQDYVENYVYGEDIELTADEVFDDVGAKRVLELVEMYTTKLEVVARFSNGETIYNIA